MPERTLATTSRPPLHPSVQSYLDRVAAANAPPYSALTAVEARSQVSPCPEPRETVQKVVDLRIPGPGGDLPIRIYDPIDFTTRSTIPTAVFLHGGGWMLCDVEVYDGLCRTLANSSGCRIVSVEYRLSPEFKFPAALDDTYATVSWVAEQSAARGSVSPIAVIGDSAGGNLAAAVCLMARDRGGPKIDFQLLIYPITDFSFDTLSYRENANGYRLTRDSMEFFWRYYLADPQEGQNPYASPLRAATLGGLPAAAVLTAEYDPLRDEGRAYATRLRESGVAVQEIHVPDHIHGYLRHTDQFPKARETLLELGAILRKALHRNG